MTNNYAFNFVFSIHKGLYLCFLLGMLYKKAVYGSAGSDLIPNIDFWASLPGLIRDGYMFFISPCLGHRAEYRTYRQIETWQQDVNQNSIIPAVWAMYIELCLTFSNLWDTSADKKIVW